MKKGRKGRNSLERVKNIEMKSASLSTLNMPLTSNDIVQLLENEFER